jgi:transketolase
VRKVFASELVELAERDERIVLLTGDLGYTVLEPFVERFPDRFYNVGVAEQNLVGLATGLADAGFVPFCYSIATFGTLRPYEFIRNGPLAHDLPVRIVGVGGGFDYGENGLTHYALEDVALMRAQPRMTVLTPADDDQAGATVRLTAELPGPAYLRVARAGPSIAGLDGRFRLGRLEAIGSGSDVVLIALGAAAAEAVGAAEALRAEGLAATVAVVSSFNPSPTEDLVELLAGVPLAVSVEAHYVTGGLGSFVAETIAEAGLDCRLVRCGVRTMPTGESGSREYLQEQHGLSPAAIARATLAAAAPRSAA